MAFCDSLTKQGIAHKSEEEGPYIELNAHCQA
jgi:hypothetical protein